MAKYTLEGIKKAVAQEITPAELKMADCTIDQAADAFYKIANELEKQGYNLNTGQKNGK